MRISLLSPGQGNERHPGLFLLKRYGRKRLQTSYNQVVKGDEGGAVFLRAFSTLASPRSAIIYPLQKKKKLFDTIPRAHIFLSV